MKLRDLKDTLRKHPTNFPQFILPNGDRIPPHFHITEVGHVIKRFIDCGGKVHDPKDTCLLQTWLGDDIDHRLNAGTFAQILDLGAEVLPHDNMDVEVEYDCCVVSQYPIAKATLSGDEIEFELGAKRTDCLAKERCGIGSNSCEASTADEKVAACC